MKLTKFPTEFDDVVRDLARELGRLEVQQGRLARKNARQGVLRVQLRLRRLLDAAYPSLRPEKPQPANVEYTIPQARPKPLSPAQHTVIFKRKMRTRGYAACGDTELMTKILEGGVNLARPPKRSDHLTPYAPAWAVLAAQQGGAKKVAEARKSVRTRLALLGAARLTGKLRELGLNDFRTDWQKGNLMAPLEDAA